MHPILLIIVAFVAVPAANISIMSLCQNRSFNKLSFRLLIVGIIGFLLMAMYYMPDTKLTIIYLCLVLGGGIYLISTTSIDSETEKLLNINYIKLSIWSITCIITDLALLGL